jgi:hypothetical protein
MKSRRQWFRTPQAISSIVKLMQISINSLFGRATYKQKARTHLSAPRDAWECQSGIHTSRTLASWARKNSGTLVRSFDGGFAKDQKRTLCRGVEPRFRAEHPNFHWMTGACTNRYTNRDLLIIGPRILTIIYKH